MTREEILNALSIENITFGGNSRRLAQFFEALDIVTESYTNIGGDWIPCSERLPEEKGKYSVTIKQGDTVHTTVRRFNPKPKHPEQNEPLFTKRVPYYSGWERATCGVIAWKPLDEPYKGE